MEIELGRFRAQTELPEPVKFASPVVLLPELFSPPRHLAIVLGYLVSIGWEVFLPDLRTAIGQGATPTAGNLRFDDLVALAGEAIDAVGRDVVVLGHGIGGLAALKLGARKNVKASVAYAPLIPGFATPLGGGLMNRIATMRARPVKPPTGRVLFEFISDAEQFAREALIKSMVPESGALIADVVRGGIDFGTSPPHAPRLVVAGDSDIFAPYDRVEKFAQSIGAKLAKIPGRGHWLVGGRGLERAIHETQRFLVRALGQDLLLLYPEEWKKESEDDPKEND